MRSPKIRHQKLLAPSTRKSVVTASLAAFALGLGTPRSAHAAAGFFDFLDPLGIFDSWFGGGRHDDGRHGEWSDLDEDRFFDDYDGHIGSYRPGSIFSDVFDTVDYVGGWFDHLDEHFFGRHEVPRACADLQRISGCWGTDYTHKQYERAVKRGRRFVLKRWSKHKDCRDLESFVEQINQKLKFKKRPKRRRALKMCQFGGFSDGALEALEGIREGCELSCAQDGRLVGKVSANIYCSLSQLTQGLEKPSDFVRGPVKLCGKAFQDSCDESFVENAQEFVDAKGECRPFTEGEFEETFDQHRNNMCIFETRPEGEESGSSGGTSSAPDEGSTGEGGDQTGAGGSTGADSGAGSESQESEQTTTAASEGSGSDQSGSEPAETTTDAAQGTTSGASENGGGVGEDSASSQTEAVEDSSNPADETSSEVQDSTSQEPGSESAGAQETGADQGASTGGEDVTSESAGAQETGADQGTSTGGEDATSESAGAQETGSSDETQSAGGEETAIDESEGEQETATGHEASTSEGDAGSESGGTQESGAADQTQSAGEEQESSTTQAQGGDTSQNLPESSEAQIDASGTQESAEEGVDTGSHSSDGEGTSSGEQGSESDSSTSQDQGEESGELADGTGSGGSSEPTDAEQEDRVAAAPLLGAPGYFFLLLGAGGLATSRRRKRSHLK